VATVLLLRHARTTANAEGTLAGRRPVELDARGRGQALELGERLRRAALPFAAVASSPLRRCLQTLQLALPEASATIDDRLVECGYGDWTGQPLQQLAQQPLWQVLQTHPSAAGFGRSQRCATATPRSPHGMVRAPAGWPVVMAM
jgi:broad specificity phosphatase PhoE